MIKKKTVERLQKAISNEMAMIIMSTMKDFRKNIKPGYKVRDMEQFYLVKGSNDVLMVQFETIIDYTEYMMSDPVFKLITKDGKVYQLDKYTDFYNYIISKLDEVIYWAYVKDYLSEMSGTFVSEY